MEHSETGIPPVPNGEEKGPKLGEPRKSIGEFGDAGGDLGGSSKGFRHARGRFWGAGGDLGGLRGIWWCQGEIWGCWGGFGGAGGDLGVPR